ncbi:MAG: rhomboid family intramembrane serine protease [Parapedobacter sp.]|nr:MAG: rhomboid family intramembrane serine protease [Parapedobacter sp.]
MFPQFREATISYVFLTGVIAASLVGFYHRGFYYANVFQPSQVFSGKRVWTVVTSAFIHGGWLHLLCNVVFCLIFMTDVEYMLVDDFGPVASSGILCLLFVGTVSTVNLITGYRFRKQPYVSAVGLSAFCFAMVVFYFIYFPLDTSPNLPMLRAYQYAMAVPLGCVIAWAANIPGNHAVHLAGCVLGMLAALVIRPEIMAELWAHFRT